MSDPLRPHGLQHARPPCRSPTPRVYSDSCPLCQWCHNHLILCHPLLLLPSVFPSSGSFPMSHFFTSGGQSTGVSALASVLPMNIQDWSPLGWTGWIALQSKGLSRVFSNTTVRKHHETQLWCQKVWELLVYSTQGYGVLKGRTHYLNETTCLQVLYILGDILYIQPHQTPA